MIIIKLSIIKIVAEALKPLTLKFKVHLALSVDHYCVYFNFIFPIVI